jgi:hypothetical protein
MRSLLRFLYRADRREILEQPPAAEMLGGRDETPEHFSVKWVVHRYETLAVEVENCPLQNLDKIVESCRGRLPEMRRKYPNTPPDGFLVFNGAGNELRRWFESPRPPM